MFTTFDYSYNAGTTAPPGGGQLRLDNADQTAATVAYVSDVDAPGVDWANVLPLIPSGATMLVQDKDDSGSFQRYTTGEPIDQSGYVEIPLTWDSGGSSFPTGQRVLVVIVTSDEPTPPEPPSYAGAPDLDDVKAWLGLDQDDTTDDVVLQESLDAALSAQAAVCLYPVDDDGNTYYSEDLREAVFLRTQRLAARRNSPEGVVGLQGVGGEFVGARVPTGDPDVLRLEGPHLAMVVT